MITGDGDALSIGGNHLIHALRRNVNIKILLFNNRIYGLTKGQYSPTSEQGKVTKSTPFGSLDHPFNPVSLALGAEASFVARSVDSDRKHLQSVMRAAADHEGSAFIEIFQNCPIFNDDAFAPLKEPAAPGLIRLEHGSPVRCTGPTGRWASTYGPYGSSWFRSRRRRCPTPSWSCTTRRRHDPAYAFALSRLDCDDFSHTPIGVFRSVERGRPTTTDGRPDRRGARRRRGRPHQPARGQRHLGSPLTAACLRLAPRGDGRRVRGTPVGGAGTGQRR